jgi:hypothetical protein
MLERWNIGRMGFGILECWVNGPPKSERKIIIEQHPLKSPLFHPSSIPIFHDYGKKLKSQKISHISIKLYKFQDVEQTIETQRGSGFYQKPP